MFDITFACKEDKNAVRDIWEYCFHDSQDYMDSFFNNVYKTENTIVAKTKDCLVAALQLFPQTLCLKTGCIKSMYVGGVSVLPSYRGQNIASALLSFAEQYMIKNGFSISFLIPFSFPFYAKLGYECLSFLSEYSGDIQDLKPYIHTDSTLFPISALPCDGYFSFVNKFDAFLERDNESFNKEIYPLCENAHIYSFRDVSEGYLIYSISNGQFYALECAYKDDISLRNILGFIYAHRSEVSRFLIRTASDSIARKVLSDKRFCENRYPLTMAKSLSNVLLPDPLQTYINMLGWF